MALHYLLDFEFFGLPEVKTTKKKVLIPPSYWFPGERHKKNRQYQTGERRFSEGAYQRVIMEVLVQYDLCNQIYDISYPLRQPVNSYVHRIYVSQKKKTIRKSKSTSLT